MNITKQMLRKCFDANRPIGKWLIQSRELNLSLILFPGVTQVIGSDYWSVFSPHTRSVFLANFFQHREIKKQPIRLSNSGNWKLTHGQESGRKASNNKVAIHRKNPHGFAKSSNHAIYRSLKLATKHAHAVFLFDAKSSEKMNERKLADKCKPIRADFEFNEFLRGSPPKSEKNPFPPIPEQI